MTSIHKAKEAGERIQRTDSPDEILTSVSLPVPEVKP